MSMTEDDFMNYFSKRSGYEQLHYINFLEEKIKENERKEKEINEFIKSKQGVQTNGLSTGL